MLGPGPPAAAEHAASFILSMLLRKRQVHMPVEEVLLSTSRPALAMRALEQANRRASRAARATQGHAPKPVLSQAGSLRAVDLLMDLPGFARKTESAPLEAQFVILTTGHPSMPLVSDNTVSLSLSLLDVAQLLRARHRERMPSFAASSTKPSLDALLEGAPLNASLKSAFELYCGPASKDLVLVDIPADVDVDNYLWESLFVAESMLEADGTLVVVSPKAFPGRVRRFLQWRFRRAQCAVSEVCASHFAVCSAVAADFGDAAVRRNDFPGLLAAGKRRPRTWNPYRRSQAQKFVVSMRPGFTNAPLIKDTLRCSLERERDSQELLRNADDAFFAVAHEMVERGTYYSHPSD
ncbi:hypothetical protein JKF63_03174 [Porcisia hertigi]|uniref:Uncharacterized protein n=1 Tax=Porcisia hertigi TaxID=2761500 RepID=A0A836IA66_9TRYP|nr:hypothetical protein JKF63_03174 [Porcisia hertigi]